MRTIGLTTPVSADDLIASKEMFHEIGGELDCAFNDLGLPITPPHIVSGPLHATNLSPKRRSTRTSETTWTQPSWSSSSKNKMFERHPEAPPSACDSYYLYKYEVLEERSKYKAIAEEVDQTFADLSGY
ncbi:hypothetical protein MSG28_012225 [Choristoneura fumiferana]|uniref:Uncharacterized protein n=1 Tax=Choristoneura fumiferana TaxID=7141 RepID=A0ACC0KCY4_CHOFU|nr:hypothetical protein MSG28_012225 [Choristoneura fumiferana]